MALMATLKQTLADVFLPRPELVSPDFFAYRRYAICLGLLQAVKDALTAQALLIAIGVGDSDATPASYILITEANTAAGRLLGLALAGVTRAEFFASEAGNSAFSTCW